jgi:hypothetical protein
MNSAGTLVIIKQWSGYFLALFTFIIHRYAASGHTTGVYGIYSRMIYPGLRKLYDHTLGNLPFPFIYVVISLLAVLLAVMVRQAIKTGKIKGMARGIVQFFLLVINLAGWLYFLFYFLWGFNYYGPTLSSRLNLPLAKPDSLWLTKEIEGVTATVNLMRRNISTDTTELETCPDWDELELYLRNEEAGLLASLGQRTDGKVRIRALRPKGLLLRFSTAGVYIPFACEGHVDPGLHCLQWPFTMAHEMAHGYGFTDEGECNFIALLVCSRSDRDLVRYSALLTYWKYLYFDVSTSNDTLASKYYYNLHAGVRADLKAIRKASDKYPDIMPQLRDLIYDNYLKSHGVKKGLASYNEIVDLMYKWQKSGRRGVFVTGDL